MIAAYLRLLLAAALGLLLTEGSISMTQAIEDSFGDSYSPAATGDSYSQAYFEGALREFLEIPREQPPPSSDTAKAQVGLTNTVIVNT